MQVEYADVCSVVTWSSMRQLMGVPDRAEAGEGPLGRSLDPPGIEPDSA